MSDEYNADDPLSYADYDEDGFRGDFQTEDVYDALVHKTLVHDEARAESDEDLARAEDEAYNDLFGREVEKPRG